MPTDFQQTNDLANASAVAAHCSGNSNNTDKESCQASEGGTPGTNAVVVSMDVSAADLNAVWTEIIDIDAYDGAAGDWTVRLRVDVANMNVTLDEVHICHVDSSYAAKNTLGSLTGIGTALSTATTYTNTVNQASSVSIAAGDKIIVIWAFDNGKATGQDFRWVKDQIITGPGSTGGGPFALSLSDSLGLADSVLRVAHGNRAPAESLGLSPSPSRVADYFRAASEAAGLADSASRDADYFRPAAEALGLADAAARDVDYFRSASDPLGLADSASRDVDYFRPVVDSLALADEVALLVSGGAAFGLSLSDSLGLSDDPSLLTLSGRALSDGLGLPDAFARAADALRSPAESLALSETLARAATALRSPSESLALSDSVSRAADLLRAIADTLALADSVSEQLISAIVGTGPRAGWRFIEPGRTWRYQEPGRTWRYLG